MAESDDNTYPAKKKKAEELLLAQRLPEARNAYLELCQLDPNDFESWLNLGAVEGMLGHLDRAEAGFKKALSLRHDEPRIYINLARLYEAQGRPVETVDALIAYINLKPEDPDVYARLGRVLHKAGQTVDAVRAMGDAINLNPNEATYYSNLGVMLSHLGRSEEALESFKKAVTLKPEMDEAHVNLGNLYHNIGEGELARASYATALKINPNNAAAYMNLGFHHARSGRNDEALSCFHKAIQLQPNYAGAHWNLSLLLLLLGRFREGWQEYEWRFQCDEVRKPEISERLLSKPMWDGSPLTDKTLLVFAEQGFGDTLQFCRYLPLLKDLVKHLVFECQPELYRLLQGQVGSAELIARSDDRSIPDIRYDLQLPLLSLPRLFDTDLDNMPNAVPYIEADTQQAEQWRQRLAGDEYKVGLVWAGSPDHRRDSWRSTTLEQLAPLAEIQGVCFYSLQKGASSSQATIPPAGMRLIDLSSELDDFATTAAVVVNLDLVITVDTSVAHLAGAMGKPVWTLIYSPPDWRWLLNRDDSPWYPTMRLFRREIGGEWGPVIAQVAAALREAVAST